MKVKGSVIFGTFKQSVPCITRNLFINHAYFRINAYFLDRAYFRDMLIFEPMLIFARVRYMKKSVQQLILSKK